MAIDSVGLICHLPKDVNIAMKWSAFLATKQRCIHMHNFRRVLLRASKVCLSRPGFFLAQTNRNANSQQTTDTQVKYAPLAELAPLSSNTLIASTYDTLLAPLLTLFTDTLSSRASLGAIPTYYRRYLIAARHLTYKNAADSVSDGLENFVVFKLQINQCFSIQSPMHCKLRKWSWANVQFQLVFLKVSTQVSADAQDDKGRVDYYAVAHRISEVSKQPVDGQSLQQGILADEMGLGKTICSNLAAHIPHRGQETTRALSYHRATVNDDELVRRICKVGADGEDERATPHNVATSKANCRWVSSKFCSPHMSTSSRTEFLSKLKWVHMIIGAWV
ncbi:uncharacterized protein F5891DRAFT_1197509 [Suillus fuscotomentosus]|uniref:Uncharacterized protein n=1 Tax=Suillus fuscotomentosus TaxID=1912939 RepID=A0AAD4DRR5_9AGAM|nr:uncharacterized protein F5891DRAFT_1197509 [Suillus fuscotomentosus]KAG1891742.1 hypothetical protein F5891DRAFT_1197509 [Suillus fuscotomentosus]